MPDSRCQASTLRLNQKGAKGTAFVAAGYGKAVSEGGVAPSECVPVNLSGSPRLSASTAVRNPAHGLQKGYRNE